MPVTRTGAPLSSVGSKRQPYAESTAALINNGWPLTARLINGGGLALQLICDVALFGRD
jgi:hypothetical protein